MAQTKHQQRIFEELKHAGVRPLELHRHMFKLIPDIIRSNEHIEAIAYGLNAHMWHAALVATDHRVVYIEADLVFSSVDEVPYEIVHGTRITQAPLRIGLRFKTLAKDYNIRYVNKRCGMRFVAYIENRVSDMADLPSAYLPKRRPINSISARPVGVSQAPPARDIPLAHIFGVQRTFLKKNHLLTLSTTERDGTLVTQRLRYHMHGDNLYAIADSKMPSAFDLKQPLSGLVQDAKTGQAMQLKVILKIEMNPAVLSMGLGLEDKVPGSNVYRISVIDLAFVANAS